MAEGTFFVNKPPSVQEADGLFMVTVRSGDVEFDFAFTRHAARGFWAKLRSADTEALFEATPFQRRQTETVE